MDSQKVTWFKSLPKWLQWIVRILVAILVAVACVTGYGLTSCGNTKVLLRNAHSASVTQQGSDIEVTVSADMDSLSLSTFKKRK